MNTRPAARGAWLCAHKSSACEEKQIELRDAQKQRLPCVKGADAEGG